MPLIDIERRGQVRVVDALRAERRDFQVPRADVVLVMGAVGHGVVPVLAPAVQDLEGEAGIADRGEPRRHDFHRGHGRNPRFCPDISDMAHDSGKVKQNREKNSLGLKKIDLSRVNKIR